MLKEKWKRLALREKMLVISGILAILSITTIFFESIYMYFMPIAINFFIVTVLYNLYKYIKNNNM